MADEIGHDYDSGDTLYATRFQLNGDVFITDGSSDELWGAGDADDYDVTMPEKGSSGHYVGDFDTSSNISAGVYRVTVYLQAGANPVDADRAIGMGVIHWDGTAEIDVSTLDATIEDDVIGADGDTLESLSGQMDDLASQIDDDVIGSDGDTLETLSDQMDELSLQKSQVVNVYDDRKTGG